MITREKAITRTSIIGIIANVFLAAFKAFAGIAAGSVAIVLDAVNNLSDAFSSVVTIVGIKLAKKRPDRKHPYGYGRMEYFSTVIIALLILWAGSTSIIESVKKIIEPTVPAYSKITIVIILVSVVTKLVLGRYVKAKGEQYNSDALVASGADASFDAIISASTLLGAIAVAFFHISIDGFIGVMISVFIIKAGLEMLLEALSDVMGNRPDSEITGAIKQCVREVPEVMDTFDLVLHNYGPDMAIGSIHVEIPAEITALRVHQITKEIQNRVLDKFHVFLTVGIYAIDTEDQAKIEMRKVVGENCCSFDGVLNAHGIYIDTERKYMSFDVTVDFTVKDRTKLHSLILAKLKTLFPGYELVISFDTNFSD
ncbi:MAG: cation diffusion facilitator family transporter [Lachnospiraceae bacterium]|nr:cation diffusion facilitator family transporter [Lachnospiraceae bacterium]